MMINDPTYNTLGTELYCPDYVVNNSQSPPNGTIDGAATAAAQVI